MHTISSHLFYFLCTFFQKKKTTFGTHAQTSNVALQFWNMLCLCSIHTACLLCGVAIFFTWRGSPCIEDNLLLNYCTSLALLHWCLSSCLYFPPATSSSSQDCPLLSLLELLDLTRRTYSNTCKILYGAGTWILPFNIISCCFFKKSMYIINIINSRFSCINGNICLDI